MASEINPTEIRNSAFQARLPLPNGGGVLVKCEDSKSSLITPMTNNSNLRGVPTATTSSSSSNNNNGNGNGNSNSPKMGSRRIFTPQFKLQVLESYRSDSDCKGNQRATARKYNIHRRQIQKWLQCEPNLRSSVANINQNSVKHQFHNISHHHQQQQQQQQHHQQQHSAQRLSLPIVVPSASRNNGYSHHSHHTHHNHPQVPLDAATAHQTLALNSLHVPSMPARVAAAASSNATSAQGVLVAANLAAAVAVAIASSSSPSTSSTSSAVSPLRPTAIGGTVGGNVSNSSVSTISPSMLHSHHHHHHQHHYPLSPYARSPVAAPVPVSVNMLPHHIAPPLPTSPQSHALHHHQHYPYHNLSPHTHTHAHALPLSHQPSAFLPTACLPVNVLSAVAAAASPPANATTTAADMQEHEQELEDNCTDANANVHVNFKAKLCELIPDTTTNTNINTNTNTETIHTTTTTAAPAVAVLMGTSARSYMHESINYDECVVYKGASMYLDAERMRDAVKCKNAFQPTLYHHQYSEQDTLNTSTTMMMMTSPIDLSVGSRRKSRENFVAATEFPSSSRQMNDVTDDDKSTATECHSQETTNNNNNNDYSISSQVVDLTFRKRKVVAACSSSANDTEQPQPQKFAKRLEDSSSSSCVTNIKVAIFDEGTTSHNVTQKTRDTSNHNDDNDDDDDGDVEIEVEVDVDAKLLSSKPVKLFKPYLLDDTDDGDGNSISKSNGNGSLKQSLVMNEQREPIIWSNHPAFNCDNSRASSLHSPTNDKHTFPNGSPYFLTSKASSPQSVFSPTPAPSLSPTSFPLRCPKGSPVSGYESSSSTCSERDDTYSVIGGNRTYSLDFQMHTVCENKMSNSSLLHKPIHISEWLDQDTNANTNTPPLARASIALYA